LVLCVVSFLEFRGVAVKGLPTTIFGRWCVPTLAVFVLSSCSVGPDYRAQAQAPATPAKWSSDDGDKAAPADAMKWWTTFADPVLDQLVTQARERNLDLRLAQARLREVRANFGIERSRLGPEIDATGGINRSRISQSNQFGGGALTTTWQAGFDAAWEIDLFGGTRRAIEAAGAEIEYEEFRVGDVLVSITAETVVAYLDLRAADEKLLAVEQALAAQDKLRDLISRRVAGGLADHAELAQAEADLANTRTRRAPLQVMRAQALTRLALLVGELPTAPDEKSAEKTLHLLSTPDLLKSSAVPDPTRSLAPGLSSEFLLRRPDLRAAERAVAAATARIGVAKADYFPRFSLTGAFGWTANDSDNLFSVGNRGWSIGPSVRWPLFSTGRIANQVKAADARLEQAGLRYEKAVLQAAGEVEDALVRTARARDQVSAAVAALSARARAGELARRRYERGLVDVAAVLEQERLLADARVQVVDARAEQGIALAALAKALGGGWPQLIIKK
jgi:outer membrane protein, multidrug efflux system